MPPLKREELIEALLKDIDPNQDPDLYNDTRQAFEEASEDKLFSWYNQQNDPGQARENAWNAGVEASETDLSRNNLPELSGQAKDDLAKEMANDLNSLEKALTLDQTHTQDNAHEQEQEQ